jgi:spoIIIJ-associated protein
MASESAYQEFTGKSVEEALKIACETFKVGLADLDFEIIAPGSKGVLGMGAEPARIVAAPASAIAGSAMHTQPQPSVRSKPRLRSSASKRRAGARTHSRKTRRLRRASHHAAKAR